MSSTAVAHRLAELRWPSRGRIAAVAAWSVPPVVLATGIQALTAARVTEIGPLGLVSALPPRLYAALAALTVGFVVAVFRRGGAPRALLAAHVVVLVVLLFGAAPIIEPLPRLLPGWLHVGFADYIARTGETLPQLDARFSWPGFFALVAMATRAAGMPDAMPLLGWAPVAFNLLYVAAVFRLARATSSDVRTAWLAVWLFVPANWVGQDYFGPQALNYLFYLVLLTVLLVWFRPRAFDHAHRHAHRPLRDRLSRMIRLPAPPLLSASSGNPYGVTSLLGLMVVVVVVFAASTASHQLTPVAIAMSVALLVLVRQCRVRALPVLLGVMVVGHLSYFTVPYWSGHLDEIFGSLGNVLGVLNSGAVERVQGDATHQIVVLFRVELAAAVWGLAALGAWRRMRAGDNDPALVALAGAPFLLLSMQSYGGEILLRVYSFALPFMAVLVAAHLAPVRRPRRALVMLMAVVLSAALTGAFFIARYGNESFEQVRRGDLAAVDWLYAHAPAGTSFVAATSNVPWRSRHVERYRYSTVSDDDRPVAVSAVEDELRANPSAFLILSRGQYVFGESFLGKPPGWGSALEQQVIGSGRFRQVYANADARVYVLTKKGEIRGGNR
ncbi:hypothetical protein SAMN05444365_104173 [Micromonospora pattaloongensis]|uniref:Uncharacterized protein n=1 Tax=Micromonospora pattaloongensis TaxID=405436 RepID=A0A1H3NV66_9ACTN|nr:hypothetical protein [Micromonospora pattaloongensis]SDY92630.1 hypothetical protein SAMN05444365_104173 [Micromonospora pattaloongensis]